MCTGKNTSSLKTYNDVYITDNIIFSQDEQGNNNFYKMELKGIIFKDTIKTSLIESEDWIITQEQNDLFLFQSKYDNGLNFQLQSKQVESLNQNLLTILIYNAENNLKIQREEEQRRAEEEKRKEEEKIKENKKCQNYYNELALYMKKNKGLGYAVEETHFFRIDIYGNRLRIPAIYFADINSIYIGTFNWANGEGKTQSFRVEANGEFIEIARPGEHRNQNITENAAISLQNFLRCKFNKNVQIRYGRT
jgi:hypothetical protein